MDRFSSNFKELAGHNSKVILLEIRSTFQVENIVGEGEIAHLSKSFTMDMSKALYFKGLICIFHKNIHKGRVSAISMHTTYSNNIDQ